MYAQSDKNHHQIRSQFLIFASLFLFVGASVSAVVPVEINFQGRLADDNSINLPDGLHTVQFGLFADSVGGNSLWLETIEISTIGGLFSHRLGSITPLTSDLFASSDRWFLQLTADGTTLSPRSPLSSVPFALVAGDLQVTDSEGQSVIKIDGDLHRLAVAGSDGADRIILNGKSIGGQILLMNDEEEIKVGIHAGLTGDQAVIFPDSAINSNEMLNEPGLTIDINITPMTLVAMEMTDLAIVDIEIPEEGYIVLEGKCYLELSGTTGANMALIQIDENEGGSSQFPYYSLAGLAGYVNNESNYFPVYVTRVYWKSKGVHIFRLEGRAQHPAPAISKSWDHVLTARYYPTGYGPVKSIVSDPKGRTAIPVQAIDPTGDTTVQTYYKIDLRDNENSQQPDKQQDNQ